MQPLDCLRDRHRQDPWKGRPARRASAHMAGLQGSAARWSERRRFANRTVRRFSGDRRSPICRPHSRRKGSRPFHIAAQQPPVQFEQCGDAGPADLPRREVGPDLGRHVLCVVIEREGSGAAQIARLAAKRLVQRPRSRASTCRAIPSLPRSSKRRSAPRRTNRGPRPAATRSGRRP